MLKQMSAWAGQVRSQAGQAGFRDCGNRRELRFRDAELRS